MSQAGHAPAWPASRSAMDPIQSGAGDARGESGATTRRAVTGRAVSRPFSFVNRKTRTAGPRVSFEPRDAADRGGGRLARRVARRVAARIDAGVGGAGTFESGASASTPTTPSGLGPGGTTSVSFSSSFSSELHSLPLPSAARSAVMPATSTNASVDAKHARPDARRERGREEARPMRRASKNGRARSPSWFFVRPPTRS